jgi:hypothetical protein
LRAATACAAMARHRENDNSLRDAEHFSPDAGGDAPPAPPDASIACGACSRPAQCGSTPRPCESRPILLD